MEVEQRTKAWVSQQPQSNQSSQQPPSSGGHKQTQITMLENVNNQLKAEINEIQFEHDEKEVRQIESEQNLIDLTQHVMHQVTQVRTPDELQNIYKELLKLKTVMSSSFTATFPADRSAISNQSDSKPKGGSALIDSARKQNSRSVLSSGQKRVTFPAVLAQPMDGPKATSNGQQSANKSTSSAIRKS